MTSLETNRDKTTGYVTQGVSLDELQDAFVWADSSSLNEGELTQTSLFHATKPRNRRLSLSDAGLTAIRIVEGATVYNDIINMDDGVMEMVSGGAVVYHYYTVDDTDKADVIVLTTSDVGENHGILEVDDGFYSVEIHRDTLMWTQMQDESFVDGIDLPDEIGETQELVDTISDPWPSVRRGFAKDNDDAVIRASEALRDEQDIITYDGKMLLYEADTGVYEGLDSEDGSKDAIERIITQNLGDQWTSRDMKEIIKHVESLTLVDDSDSFNAGNQSEPLVSVGNGVLNLVTGELLEDDPDYLFTRGIQTDWNPDADTSEILDFFDDVFARDEDWMSVMECVGNGLYPGYKHQYLLTVTGPGGSGKGVLTTILEEMIGRDYTAHASVHDLQNDQNAVADLQGSFLNVDTDASGKKIKDANLLKKLTGDDIVATQQKYVNRFDHQNEAQIMVVSNNPFVIDDDPTAIMRRIVPIEMPFRFTMDDEDEHGDADPNLADKLTTDGNMEALLVMAVEGIQRLEENNDVSLPESATERLEKYQSMSDPLRRFFGTCVTESPGDKLRCDTFISAANAFLNKSNEPDRSRNQIYRVADKSPFIPFLKSRETSGDRKLKLDRLTLTEQGREICPDGVLEEDPFIDFGNPEEVAQTADVSPLTAIQEGMSDVRVTVLRNESGGSDMPSVDVTVECVESGHRMQVVSWDDGVDFADDLIVGSEVVMTDVHYSEPDLQLLRGVTEIKVVSRNADSGDQSSLDDSASESESEMSQEERASVVMEYVEENEDPDDRDDGLVPVDEIVDAVTTEHSVTTDTVRHTVENMVESGDLMEPLQDGRVVSL